MNAATDWTTALVAAGLGALLGALLLWRGRAYPAVTSGPPSQDTVHARDLAARRDALLHQLREMEDTGAKIAPEVRARQRYALELEAAGVLLDLDGVAAATPTVSAVPPGGAAPAPAPREASSVRGFLWGAGTAGAVAALVFAVSQASAPRPEGGSLTGELPAAAATPDPHRAEAAAHPADAEMNARIAHDPDDVEARLELTRTALGRQDLMAVWTHTQAVLERWPGHPMAVSYQALVRLAMGQADAAEAMLKDAVARAPQLLEARLHLALVYARTGRMALAESTMAEAMAAFPEQRVGLERLLGELRRAEANAPAAAPGMTTAQAPETPMTSGGIAGRLELDASAQGRVPAGSIVFVTLRAAGAEGGPPVAVQRLAAGAWPQAFRITAADSMMGQELPARVRIEARVDADGDPLSRSPQDPSARLDDVALGARDLRLVLR